MKKTKLSDLPEWAQYIAQDADGQWWAYETEPNLSHISWYENEVGQILKLEREKPDINWHKTLQKIAK
ncbi:MAG: hypothetical protein KAQ67_09555 [Gammaproteobacteria bacterium]|nr:hypothetical protein [Gammaproteobacteria bacterium]